MSDTVGGKNELSAIKAPLFREVKKGETRRHIISVLVRNELGVLARIATLIAGKGYNIEGLSVGETHEKGFSLMTIEVIGDDVVIEQVVKQLRKLIDTIKVRDLTDSPHVERGACPDKGIYRHSKGKG
jgi:acetolactate synthase-1/3 small subunit